MIELGPAGLALAFAAGIVSFTSPCVLPLVPGYLCFVSGVGFDELG
ncbi:MAG: cytochrome c biogenesis protein CcdA, partial [Solirubrobacterales bacterium]